MSNKKKNLILISFWNISSGLIQHGFFWEPNHCVIGGSPVLYGEKLKEHLLFLC